jgi:excisionase family DNA binding protein
MTEKDLQPVYMKPVRFAKYLDLGRSKVYDMLARGELRGVKIGGVWRIPASELDRLQAETINEAD